jgi:hypothetical protein
MPQALIGFAHHIEIDDEAGGLGLPFGKKASDFLVHFQHVLNHYGGGAIAEVARETHHCPEHRTLDSSASGGDDATTFPIGERGAKSKAGWSQRTPSRR